jgi:hypothetical protein
VTNTRLIARWCSATLLYGCSRHRSQVHT